MALNPEDRRTLELLFGESVQEHVELGLPLIVVPSVPLPSGCRPPSSMAIYIPAWFQGYTTRLFFEEPITLKSGVCPQTASTVLLGRTMYAASIQDVPADLPPHQAILAHLKRYRASS
jgi:hypothetical protein